MHFSLSTRALKLAAALCCATIASGQTPAAARAAPPVVAGLPKVSPDGSMILFFSNGEGTKGYSVMSSTGWNVRRLTPPAVETMSADWAGDSRHVLAVTPVTAGAFDSTRLFIGDIESGTWKQIAGGGFIHAASSRDGQQILFSVLSIATRTADIFVVDATSGAAPRPLTSGSGLKFGAAFSPDGKQLVFVRSEGPGIAPKLWIAAADGSGAHPLTGGDRLDEQPAWSPDGQWIAFQTAVRGQPRTDIGLIRPDGSERRMVTTQPTDMRLETPSWFPDGKRLAVQGNQDGTMRTYVIDLAGKVLATLPERTTDNFPRFLPDGKHLVFQSNRDGGVPKLYSVALDGSAEHALSPGIPGTPSPDGKHVIFRMAGEKPPAGAMPSFSLMVGAADGSGQKTFSDLPLSQAPAWSPNGRRVAFAAMAGRPSPGSRPELAIYLADPDGSNRRRLIADDPHPYQIQPDWSHDGRRIVYGTIDTTGGMRQLRLMVVMADGTGAHALGPLGDNPVWSPDGRKILYWSVREGKGNIYTVNADGSHEQRLTDSPARDETPSWSPDGKQIAFQSDRDGAMTIYAMNADGTNLRRVRR